MAVAATGAYAAARLFSAAIVAYVVEETLIQKAPPGMDPHLLRHRLETGLSECPDETFRLKRLLEIAQILERTQKLAPDEMDGLLEGCAGGRQNASLKTGTFCFPGCLIRQGDVSAEGGASHHDLQ